MLSWGDFWGRDCARLTRRSLLQIGACSALGLNLADWLRASPNGQTEARCRSVILLWLWGGPSHHETFDPKPEAVTGVRGPFRPIATRTTGLRICELLPELANLSNMYAVIRSMAHDQKDHNVAGTIALTGNVAGAKASGGIPFPGTVRPSMGSLVARFRSNRQTAWPPFITVGPNCKVSGENLRGQTAGVLGPARDPFRIEEFSPEEGFRLPETFRLAPGLSAERLADRRQLAARLDAARRSLDNAGAAQHLDGFYAQALDLVTSPRAQEALDLTRENPRLRDRYGRTYFGQACLLARRLVQSGVPFIQVNYSGDAEDEQQGGDGGWDLHYRLFDRMQDRYCPIYDRALTALLTDLRERGLLDSTMVVAMGEFGRSPQISASAGREHWPNVYSAVLAGGGIRGGQVHGSSDRVGGEPAERPVHPANLIATVLEAMGGNRVQLNEMGLGLEADAVGSLF